MSVLVFGLVTSLNAQPTRESIAKDETISKNKKYNENLYSPSKNSFFSNLSNVNITSEFGDNSASALFASNIGSSSSVSFYFKQPFESKPKKVNFFTQDGLASGTSFDFSFQQVFWKTKITDKMFQGLKDEYAKNKKIDKSSPEYRGISVADFDDQTIAKFWASNPVKSGLPILFGAGYTVAKNEIDYIVDSFSLSPVTENRTNSNLRLTIGILTHNRSVISLSAIQEIKYESGDPITMNFPLNTNGLSYSKDVTLGIPTKKNITRIQFDYRKRFYKKENIAFAIAPSIAYRTKQKAIALELPVYFLNFKDDDKKVKGLQGGIILGYTDKLKSKTTFKDGFAFSIFVGAPFDLFGYFKTKN